MLVVATVGAAATTGLLSLLTGLAFAPVRAGLAVADAGITVATGALDLAHRTVGEEKDGVRTGRPTSMAQVLGIEDAVERANRLARLMDEDQPLGRALAPDGALDRLLKPGGVVDRLTAPGGVLDRLTQEDGGLMQMSGLDSDECAFTKYKV